MSGHGRQIIITNRTALTRKYARAGLRKIEAAVKALIESEKVRGTRTRLIYVDDAAAMKRCGGKPVSAALDPRQNKTAVDRIFQSARPAYLMILGATDVIPHQDLTNPLYSGSDANDNDIGTRWAICLTPAMPRTLATLRIFAATTYS